MVDGFQAAVEGRLASKHGDGCPDLAPSQAGLYFLEASRETPLAHVLPTGCP